MNLILKNIPITKAKLLHAASLFAEEEGTVLLYSGGDFELSKRSFLFLFPFETISVRGMSVKREGLGKSCECEGNPWDLLKEWLPEKRNKENGSIPSWVGYLDYEMGAFSDPQKNFDMHSNSYANAYFQRSAIILIVDHNLQEGTLYSNPEGLEFITPEQKFSQSQLSQLSFWESLKKHPPVSQKLQLAAPLESGIEYHKKIKEAKELIFSGEIYQVNLSQQLLFKGPINAFSLFQTVALANPAPFSAYLNLAELKVISSSPERLLLHQNGFLETRPIKGTAPRGKTDEIDQQMRTHLLNSEKEKAELIMITDLMRNDLGRISAQGSIQVDKICHIEAYANVFHMLSVISSQADPELHPLELIRACFPGGSITGCPKLRAMEVISQLEKRPRGIYTGSIGYFTENGDFDFNIAIRTAVLENNVLNIQLGGGIVADSDMNSEYAETWHKGNSLLRAIGFIPPLFS